MEADSLLYTSFREDHIVLPAGKKYRRSLYLIKHLDDTSLLPPAIAKRYDQSIDSIIKLQSSKSLAPSVSIERNMQHLELQHIENGHFNMYPRGSHPHAVWISIYR